MCQHVDTARRRGGARIDLDSVATKDTPVGKTSACKGPGRGDRARDGVAGLALAVIRSDVLDADDARFRPAKLAPQPATDEVLSHPIDPPVEIVRREKGEVPSVVAVTLDDVVRMTRDVLLVPGKTTRS